MAIEKQESAWLKKEQLFNIKLPEDGLDSSNQLSLAENKSSKYNLAF